MIGHGERGINGVFQARPVEAQVSDPRLKRGVDREVMDNERGGLSGEKRRPYIVYRRTLSCHVLQVFRQINK